MSKEKSGDGYLQVETGEESSPHPRGAPLPRSSALSRSQRVAAALITVSLAFFAIVYFMAPWYSDQIQTPFIENDME